MTTDMVDKVGGAASTVSRWQDRVGLAAMLSDCHELDSSEDVSDASENVSLALAVLDTRKRKKVLTGGRDAAIMLDQNKRNKLEFSEFSEDSRDSHLKPREVFPGEKPLVIMPVNSVLSSPSGHNSKERGAYVKTVGAAVVDASYWSTDSYNAGDEYSRGCTSTFNSSEEGSSQQCLHDPFLSVRRNVAAFSQNEKLRDDSWSGGINLLQSQLGSFIQKERQKLESEFEDGSSGLSKYSFSGPSCGYGSIEPLTDVHNGRSSGLSEHSLAGSLCGYESTDPVTGSCHEHSGSSDLLSGVLRTRSFAGISRPQHHTSSMLISCDRDKKMNGFDFPMKSDKELKRLHAKVACESEERIIFPDKLRVQRSPLSYAQLDEEVYKPNQHFVLSSGRPSHVEAVRVNTRVSTIDRDFDDYFARLML